MPDSESHVVFVINPSLARDIEELRAALHPVRDIRLEQAFIVEEKLSRGLIKAAVLAKSEPVRKHDWEQFTQAPRSAKRRHKNQNRRY